MSALAPKTVKPRSEDRGSPGASRPVTRKGDSTKTGTIVPHKKRQATRWFPDSYYSMHGDAAMMEFAEAQPLPTPMRLFFLCSARANKWGHAAFKPGEMQKLLKCSKPARLRAMASLQSAQLIAPQSTTLCVVLSGAAYRRGDRADKPCLEPGHEDRQKRQWIHYVEPDGWEPEPGYWHEKINDPASEARTAELIAEHKTRTKTKTTVTVTETETETVESVKLSGSAGLMSLARAG